MNNCALNYQQDHSGFNASPINNTDTNLDFVQVLNTAILKHKQRNIKRGYEDRLKSTCQSPAMKALEVGITYLSENQKISRDQAAIEVIDTFKQLDNIWNDYLVLEGVTNLKKIIKK